MTDRNASNKPGSASDVPDWVWIAFGLLGMLILQRNWNARIKPWLDETVPELQARDWTESIGWGIIAIPVAVLILTFVNDARKKRSNREKESK